VRVSERANLNMSVNSLDGKRGKPPTDLTKKRKSSGVKRHGGSPLSEHKVESAIPNYQLLVTDSTWVEPRENSLVPIGMRDFLFLLDTLARG